MVNSEKKHQEKKEDAQSMQDAKEKEQVISQKPKRFELTKNQKIALIGGLIVIVVVLAITILFAETDDSAKQFSDFLYLSNKSGIIMDIRNAPNTSMNSIIMQCGVNLISDGFFAKTNKDLLIYACDDMGCVSNLALQNATNQQQNDTQTNQTSQTNTTDIIVPFDVALKDMSSRAYFHIMYDQEEKKLFHSTYALVYLNATSDPTQCKLDIKVE